MDKGKEKGGSNLRRIQGVVFVVESVHTRPVVLVFGLIGVKRYLIGRSP